MSKCRGGWQAVAAFVGGDYVGQGCGLTSLLDGGLCEDGGDWANYRVLGRGVGGRSVFWAFGDGDGHAGGCSVFGVLIVLSASFSRGPTLRDPLPMSDFRPGDQNVGDRNAAGGDRTTVTATIQKKVMPNKTVKFGRASILGIYI